MQFFRQVATVQVGLDGLANDAVICTGMRWIVEKIENLFF